jgi:hypothetical protein
MVGSAGINECADVARDRREDFLALGRGKPMGDVVNFVGSDQAGHLMSSAGEVIHDARIDFTLRAR